MDHIVLDVEIQKCIGDGGLSWDDTDRLGVAVAVVWEYRTARMRVYGPDDVPALRERLLVADRISGYNIWNFDFPVVWGISRPDWNPGDLDLNTTGVKGALRPKCNDLLRRIWAAQGFDPDRWQPGMGGSKLDDIAEATIGARKVGNGADAPRWYQTGQVQRVANYCADDVAIERDLTDFVDRYGYVVRGGKQLFLK